MSNKKSRNSKTKEIASEIIEQPVEKNKTSSNPSSYSVKFRFILVAVILIIFGLLYFFKGMFIVALVNGQPITRLALIKELEKKGGKQVLDSLINETLILNEAKKQNVQVSDAEVNAEIQKIEKTIAQQGQKLDDVLKLQGMNKSSFEKEVRIQKMIEKILMPKIKVTDQEVKDYLEKNKGTLTSTDSAEIKKQLQEQKLRGEFQTWLQDIQKKAKITYFVSY